MRKALTWFLAVAFLAGGCIYSVSGSNESPANRPVIHNRTSGDLKQVLEGAAEFPLASYFTLYGSPDPMRALRRFSGGAAEAGDVFRPLLWQAYMMPVWTQNPSLKQPPPKLLVADALNTVPCDQQALAGRDLGQPFVCPRLADEPGLPSPGHVLVMPAAFNQKLLGVASKLDAEAAWRMVSTAVALLYAQYLRQVYRSSIAWPDGPVMDTCVAGMSLRAIFPRLVLPVQVDQTLAQLEKVWGLAATAAHDLRRIALTRGYLTGSLVSCIEPY